jgi:hypothetical protein
MQCHRIAILGVQPVVGSIHLAGNPSYEQYE